MKSSAKYLIAIIILSIGLVGGYFIRPYMEKEEIAVRTPEIGEKVYAICKNKLREGTLHSLSKDNEGKLIYTVTTSLISSETCENVFSSYKEAKEMFEEVKEE